MSKKESIILGVKVLIVFIFFCGGYVMWCQTLVEWWKPACWAVILGALSMPLLRRVTSCSSVIDWIGWLVLMTSMFYCAILGLNYGVADRDAVHTESAVVDRRYEKEHTRRGRRGRHMGTYHTYHIDVTFEDGRRKTFSIPVVRYRTTRTGSTVKYKVCTGCLGWKIVV